MYFYYHLEFIEKKSYEKKTKIYINPTTFHYHYRYDVIYIITFFRKNPKLLRRTSAIET